MKELVLSNGQKTQVSDEDFDFLSQWSWHLNTRRVRCQDGVFMHHKVAARMGYSDFEMIDHKDRNILNNQRENLRPATCSQNQANSSLRKDSTSGYKGVYFDKSRGKWKAQIRVRKSSISLGYFSSPEEAAKAYDKAAKRFQGEFAKVNFT